MSKAGKEEKILITFTSPSQNGNRKEKEIKKKDNCKAFGVTRKCNKVKFKAEIPLML